MKKDLIFPKMYAIIYPYRHGKKGGCPARQAVGCKKVKNRSKKTFEEVLIMIVPIAAADLITTSPLDTEEPEETTKKDYELPEIPLG